VEKNDKQRFSFNEDGTMIRANQGHSIQIDLHLTPIAPPMFLFHGTAIRFLTSILEEGLTKQSRNHVHLSSDVETARKVGSRHGAPVILKVHSGAMADNGFVFFRSENGVWLTDYVPPSFLEVR
jgi:putative RNA 2'-phosphotransferase